MSGREPYDVAVIIPHYNDSERLERCLTALTSSAASGKAEIVVVDNNSTEDLSPLHSRFPVVRFVVEATRGAAAARNRGVLETRAPMLFFLDSDCVPQPGWIKAGKVALQKADIVGGFIELFDETPPPRNGAQAFETIFAFNQKQYIEKKGFSVSANLLTWRRVFDEVGNFRSGVSEDVDWCHRALKKNYSLIYDEDVAVAHPTRKDLGELKKKWSRMIRESFELQAERPFARLRWAFRATLVLCSPLVDFRRVLFSQRLHGPREIVSGLCTLFYLRALRATWMFRQVFGGFA